MREARLVMVELAGSGLTPEQLALVMELSASLTVEARPTEDKSANKRRRRDRDYQAEKRRQNRQISAESSDTPPNEDTSNPPSETKVSKGVAPPLKSKRGSRLPMDFAVPEDWIVWAMERRRWPRADAVLEGEKFCRHFKTKTGKDAAKLDWFMTFQNWVDGSFRPNGETPPERNDRPMSADELRRAIQFNEDQGNAEKAKAYRFQLEARTALTSGTRQ